MEQNAISLAKFISRYLGVNGSGLNTLSHEDVKHLFPSLKRSTFAFVENHPLELYSGNEDIFELTSSVGGAQWF